MGQRLCSCLARSCCPTTPSDALLKPALQKKDDDAHTAAPIGSSLNQQNQQPLVVEDESWKRWSSYNLIHHQPERQQSVYTPPEFVSPGTSLQQVQQQQQQHHIVPAEAIWDL